LACAAPTPPSRCVGCGIARFCGKECQRAAWREHKPFCIVKGASPPSFAAGDIARAAAAHHGVPEHADVFEPDAEVQASVLEALGFRSDGRVLGQRPLSEKELWDAVTQGKSGLARLLFGRNSFHASYMPILRALSQDTRWPTICSARDQAHLTEIPTLELCATLATRLLCVARRLREKGHRRLIFLGIGSGDALVEASVALHVGAALGAPVDLQAEPPLRLQYGEIEVSILATDSSDFHVRQRNRTAAVPAEMRVLPFDRREAVRHFAEEAPLYVFSSWMPMGASRWRSDAEEDGGSRLAELCFLSSPPTLIKIPEMELYSKARLTVQLFPKTLGRWDFLARGFDVDGGEEAGLFHSQLYVFPDPRAPPPFLVDALRHRHGDYVARMRVSEPLQGVNYCRGIGLYHIHGPHEFDAEVPEQYMYSLRESAMADQFAVDAGALQTQIKDCLDFLSGAPHRQLSVLLRELQRRFPERSQRQ